jgi:hypothetical protein
MNRDAGEQLVGSRSFVGRREMSSKLSEVWAQILRDAPQDMLTVLVVGIGIAAAAIAVLRLVGTRRRPSSRRRAF